MFGNDKSTVQTMLSMEGRITWLEQRLMAFEALAKEYSEKTAAFNEALYEHLGIEPKELSGITFTKKDSK